MDTCPLQRAVRLFDVSAVLRHRYALVVITGHPPSCVEYSHCYSQVRASSVFHSTYSGLFVSSLITLNYELVRPPNVSREGLEFYPFSFFPFFFINPPRSAAAQWTAIRMFGRRQSYNNWYRDIAHPSPNFHRGGVKKCEIWRQSSPRFKMQQDIRILKQTSCV